METKRITVGELKQHLKAFNDDEILDFSGLEFYRLKSRGPKQVQVEFSQIIFRRDDGKFVIDGID
ncbi:MAG: hypothetical protein WD081_01965 [Gammaproteobacteria bacterium]